MRLKILLMFLVTTNWLCTEGLPQSGDLEAGRGRGNSDYRLQNSFHENKVPPSPYEGPNNPRGPPPQGPPMFGHAPFDFMGPEFGGPPRDFPPSNHDRPPNGRRPPFNVMPHNRGPPNIGPANIGPPNIGPANIVPPNIGPANKGLSNIVPPNIGPANKEPAKIVPPNIGPDNKGPPNIGTAHTQESSENGKNPDKVHSTIFNNPIDSLDSQGANNVNNTQNNQELSRPTAIESAISNKNAEQQEINTQLPEKDSLVEKQSSEEQNNDVTVEKVQNGTTTFSGQAGISFANDDSAKFNQNNGKYVTQIPFQFVPVTPEN